jgi:tetratricopeptide (TPR) repeat protein
MFVTKIPERPALRRRFLETSFGTIITVISLIIMLGWCFCGKQEAPEPEPSVESKGSTTLAVLFFQNHDPDPETDWIGRGIARLLSMQLGRHDRLDMVRHARLEAILRVMDLPNVNELSEKTLREVARRAEASRAVLGEYLIEDDRFLIDARLVDAADGTVLAEKQAQGDELSNLFQLAAEIAAALGAEFGLAGDPQDTGIGPTDDIAAYKAFIRSLEAFQRFDTPEGMTYLREAEQQDADFTLAYATRAIQAYIIGDLPRAIEAVGHAMTHPQRLPEAERLMTRAIDRHLTGQYDQGFEAFEQLTNTVRADPETHLLLAQMYYTIRDHASAEKIYRNILEQDPENVTAHIMLGLNLLEMKLIDQAQLEVEEALRLKEDHPYAHIVMSRAYAYRGNIDEAEHYLRQASRLNPKDPWIHNQLGYFYLSRNKPELALQEFQRYVELAPEDPNAYDSLAEGYLRNGQADRAEREYLRALELKPDFDNPYFMLARIYEDRDEKEKATKMFQKYLRISPRGPRAKEAESRLENLTN